MTRPVWFSWPTPHQHAGIRLPDSRPRLNVRFGKPPTDCQSLDIKSNTRSQESKINSAITCTNVYLTLQTFAIFCLVRGASVWWLCWLRQGFGTVRITHWGGRWNKPLLTSGAMCELDCHYLYGLEALFVISWNFAAEQPRIAKTRAIKTWEKSSCKVLVLLAMSPSPTHFSSRFCQAAKNAIMILEVNRAGQVSTTTSSTWSLKATSCKQRSVQLPYPHTSCEDQFPQTPWLTLCQRTSPTKTLAPLEEHNFPLFATTGSFHLPVKLPCLGGLGGLEAAEAVPSC